MNAPYQKPDLTKRTFASTIRDMAFKLLIISFLVLGACARSDVVEISPTKYDPYPAPGFAGDVEIEIKELETVLAQQDLSEADRHAAENRLADLHATKVFAPTPRPEVVQEEVAAEQARMAAATPLPTPIIELGILPKSSVYYQAHRPRQVKIENIWQGYMGENIMLVYAGQLFPDSRTGDTNLTQHGALYVMTYFPDGTVDVSLHATAEETGALTIIDVTEEGRMSLISKGYAGWASEPFFFDLPALQFSSSLEEVIPVPSITPNPYP